MKVIIAGSRKIKDYNLVKEAIEKSGFDISEVVSGRAPGVDKLGEAWAKVNLKEENIKTFPAKWDDLDDPDAIIKYHYNNTPYNANAGLKRNAEMAEYADALIAVTIGSPGTNDMINKMKEKTKPVFVYNVNTNSFEKYLCE